MQKSGRKLDPADLPPKCDWEEPVARLFEERLWNQWRNGGFGRTGLDFNVAIALAQHRGWNVDLAVELLGAIEYEILEWDVKERESERERQRR